ncbi:MAG: repeat-containing protein [Candidatus Taylorbacteria bacterium]|nr:repeat-containing protein [Candidatus Taylorbacteria bacterium]
MKKFFSSVLIVGLLLLNVSPVFAELGDVTPPPTPPPVETPPAPPAPPAEPTPSPTPEPTPTVVEPVVQTVTASDTTGPVISGAASLSLATHDATIVWTTDELSISTFEYGTTESYGSSATLDATALLAHTAILTGLTPGTIYYYCIHAHDLANNATNSCGHIFTTASQSVVVDTTPPDVSLITVAPITTMGATINFTTTEVGNARVEYGTTEGYGESANLDTNLALTHAVVLSGLTANTLYHYRIITSDEFGNETITSDETFTTEPIAGQNVVSEPAPQVVVSPTDMTAPIISGIGTASLGITDVTLAWNTNELSISTLEYGTSQSYGSHATISGTALLAHTATLTGLTASSTYYYCIRATDLAGNTANNCPNFFTTDPAVITPPSTPADTTPPQISLITVAPITTSGATIGWTTSELATSSIQYGTTASYGTTVNLSGNASLSHSTILSSLSPDTTYHYRITSTDVSGNIGMSADEIFTTDALSQVEFQTQGQPAPQVATVLISGIETTSISTSAVTIAWNTDLPSDSQVQYGNSENFGSVTALSSTLTTSHSVTITGLAPNTNYIFRVKSKPVGASVATVSTNEEFNTLNHSIPVVAPANIISVSSGGVTSTGATISWMTDKGATSQVEYGTDTTYGSSSINTETLVTSHSVSLSSLNSGTTYHYRLKSIDEVGNVTFSEDYTFTTTGSLSSVPTAPPAPIITDQGETPIVDVEGVDGEVVFEINEGNPNINEDVVIERDGAIIYEGNSETFTDTNQTNGVTHNYTVFARSSGGGSSRPVNISIAPRAGVREVKFNESGTLASSTPALHFVKTFQKGTTDIEIEHLQELLHAEGTYPEEYITGYFGSRTEAALKRFQAKHGLVQTGIVDVVTQKKLNTVSMSETKLDIPTDVVVFETDLKKGDQGESVKDLQQYLIYEGSYQEAIISGYFGNFTHNAVKIFQSKYNINPVSGIVGPKTRHKMQQLAGL